ncbi:hypothetical protein FOZ76_14550 [Verticiella sediminum]|uniref:Uncharacterized protein n=1 Tax=Verticiella sediminum TaxID=1247510 RepID=A0A556AIB9_9BURK|nr:hypothetical protein [Verticiella sediminum]TSH92637.1 hypothetical protein FOZ76_14550 [Verticiella sediminum]
MFTGRESRRAGGWRRDTSASDLPPRHEHRDPSTRQTYFHGAGRSWSRDEILRLAGFADAVRRHPTHEIIVLFHTVGEPFTALIAIPRERIAPRGADRSLATAPPFWRHGDIMHIAADRPP